MRGKEYAYGIVEAGSARCTLANRLKGHLGSSPRLAPSVQIYHARVVPEILRCGSGPFADARPFFTPLNYQFPRKARRI